MVSSFGEKELLSKVATKSKLSHIAFISEVGHYYPAVNGSANVLCTPPTDKSFYYSYQRPSYPTDCTSGIRILK